MTNRFLSPIEEIIEDARNGKMFILVDDEDRENEGDLIIPAQMATPDTINFMAKYGRGLICLTIDNKRASHLGLSFMSQNNRSRHKTAFTVSIEAKEGITTGISAPDRAHTISVAISDSRGKDDLVSPGHVFPIVAKPGGVLVRAGHTEASVDISRLAGLNPSGVICEIMKDDGTMARLPDLIEFSKDKGLKIAAIRDLIAYRLRHDHLVEKRAESEMVSLSGKKWKLTAYKNILSDAEHLVLSLGALNFSKPVLVRMHVLNIFQDLFEEDNPRSGQLARAMNYIESIGEGFVVVIREGGPKSLENLINDRNNSDNDDKSQTLKDYGIGAQILRDIGIKNIQLLTNSKSNLVGIEGFGVKIISRVPIPPLP
jgi:3,4-dihydroxy 2-butanone 4-phosphate synthase/GTP cyclohydrolase II